MFYRRWMPDHRGVAGDLNVADLDVADLNVADLNVADLNVEAGTPARRSLTSR